MTKADMLMEVLKSRHHPYKEKDTKTVVRNGETSNVPVVLVYLEEPHAAAKYRGWFMFDEAEEVLLDIWLPDHGQRSL